MRPTRKLSLLETLAANLAAECHLAAMTGRPLREDASTLLDAMRPKRGPIVNHSDDVEGPAQKAVGDLLARHPKVLWAVRLNGGAMQVDDGKGGTRPLWFYRFVRTPADDVTLTDFLGQLKDGRMLVIEMKKPSWKKPTTLRENKQAAMIRTVNAAGGLGLFAVCVEDVVRALVTTE